MPSILILLTPSGNTYHITCTDTMIPVPVMLICEYKKYSYPLSVDIYF